MGAKQSCARTEADVLIDPLPDRNHNDTEVEEETEIVFARETEEGELSRIYTGGEEEETIEFSQMNALYKSSPNSATKITDAFDGSENNSDCFLFPRPPLELIGLASSSSSGNKNILVQPPILAVSSCEEDDDDEDIDDQNLHLESLKKELKAATETFTMVFPQSKRSQTQQEDDEVSSSIPNWHISHSLSSGRSIVEVPEEPTNHEKMERKKGDEFEDWKTSAATETITNSILDQNTSTSTAYSFYPSRRRCRTSPNSRHCRAGVYRTSSTVVCRNGEDDDDVDLSRILCLRNNLPAAALKSKHHNRFNLQLPFRRCKRPRCRCHYQTNVDTTIQHSQSASNVIRDHFENSDRDHHAPTVPSRSRSSRSIRTFHNKSSSAAYPLLHSNTRRMGYQELPPCCETHHKRSTSEEDLAGLWIPLQKAISRTSGHNTIDSSRELPEERTQVANLSSLVSNGAPEGKDEAGVLQLPQISNQQLLLSLRNRVASHDFICFQDAEEAHSVFQDVEEAHSENDNEEYCNLYGHARRNPQTTNCNTDANEEMAATLATGTRISLQDWCWTNLKDKDEKGAPKDEMESTNRGLTEHHSESVAASPLTNFRRRSRSEDVLDLIADETAVPVPPIKDSRRRSRSEDVIDFISDGSASLDSRRPNRLRSNSLILDTPPTSSNSSRGVNSTQHTQLGLSLNDVEGIDAMFLPLSPTGVAELHKLTSTDDSEKHPLTPELSCEYKRGSKSKHDEDHVGAKSELATNKDISASSMLLKSYRRAIDSYKRQKGPQSLIMIIKLYHSIAWLHHQEGRYNAALCVVNHSLDRFYWDFHSCLTLNETLKNVDQGGIMRDNNSCSNEALLAELLVTKAQILLCLATASEKAQNQAPTFAIYWMKAKELAKIAVSIIEPSMQREKQVGVYDRDDYLTSLNVLAKGLLVIGQVYSAFPPPSNTTRTMDFMAVEEDGRPKHEIAIYYYQQALAMFRYYISANSAVISEGISLMRRDHLQNCAYWSLAETLCHIGNLHLSQEFFGLAKDAFWEALQLYRFMLHQEKLRVGTPCSSSLGIFFAPSSCQSLSFSVMDMVSTLANLGYIHLMEGELVLAQHSTMEALWLLQHKSSPYCPASTKYAIPTSNYQLRKASLTPDLQYLAVLEYQMGMVTIRGGNIQQGLRFLKAAFGHQREAFGDEKHVDIGITMEAIGCAYQQMGAWSKSRVYLEGALKIRKKLAGRSRPRRCSSHHSSYKSLKPESQAFLAVARIQSRLALIFLELNEHSQARIFLTKARRRYRHLKLPFEELGLLTQERLFLLTDADPIA